MYSVTPPTVMIAPIRTRAQFVREDFWRLPEGVRAWQAQSDRADGWGSGLEHRAAYAAK